MALKSVAILVVLVVLGCGRLDRQYEVDYAYEILKRGPDGAIEVVGKGKAARATRGDGGGSDVAGIGPVVTRVRHLSGDAASIEIAIPGQEIIVVDVAAKGKTAEMFPPGKDHGCRVAVQEIRPR